TVLVAAFLALTAFGPRTALAGCELRPDVNVMGLTLATPNEAGRFVGRWLGAYPLACDGEAYQLVVTADALSALQQAAADPRVSGSVYVMGDFPYFGDGVCISGAVRRWSCYRGGEDLTPPAPLPYEGRGKRTSLPPTPSL